ncbi:MAG: ABC transporter ATP-binding protein [Firmicutes bacterium]|nr:ABC transporter ATP-binding protein [Bacillota bacterium]
MLAVKNLVVRYGDIEVVHGVSISVEDGESVAVIGANGAGKTTLLRTIMGLHREFTGTVLYDGEDIGRLPPWERSRRGIAIVPEGQRVFPDLTVEENLMIGAYSRTDKREIEESPAEVYSLFPILQERKRQVSKTLSGGEQQMLAVGRALMARPRLLLVDEVSTGLMPIFVDKAFQALTELNRRGVSILLLEQNARKSLAAMSRGYVLETGKISLAGSCEDLRRNPDVQKAYLGL